MVNCLKRNSRKAKRPEPITNESNIFCWCKWKSVPNLQMKSKLLKYIVKLIRNGNWETSMQLGISRCSRSQDQVCEDTTGFSLALTMQWKEESFIHHSIA